jgi:hypothetical protein
MAKSAKYYITQQDTNYLIQISVTHLVEKGENKW